MRARAGGVDESRQDNRTVDVYVPCSSGLKESKSINPAISVADSIERPLDR